MPGSGRDYVDAKGGNDAVDAVDGEKDRVVCGGGSDTVKAGASDVLSGCEHVNGKFVR